MIRVHRTTALVGRVLRRMCSGAVPDGPHRYTIAPVPGAPVIGLAEVADGWLRLVVEVGADAAPAGPGSRPSTHWLERQAGLPAGVKYAPGRERLEVRAEMPLQGASRADWRWVVDHLCATGHGLIEAVTGALPEHLRQRARPRAAPLRRGRPRPAMAGLDAPSPVGCAALRSVCTQGGWTVLGGGPGEIRVELPTRGTYRVASVVCAHRTTRVSVELDLADAVEDATVEAVSAFLLRHGAAVKMARAWVARGDPERPIARGGFEVLLASPVPPAVLETALSALTVACEIGGAEAEALSRSESLARLYLETDAVAAKPVPKDPAPAT